MHYSYQIHTHTHTDAHTGMREKEMYLTTVDLSLYIKTHTNVRLESAVIMPTGAV